MWRPFSRPSSLAPLNRWAVLYACASPPLSTHSRSLSLHQVGKLKFGVVQSVTAFFDNVVLIHVNHLPLVITLVASNSAHIGALQTLARQLRPALTPLKKCVESADVH